MLPAYIANMTPVLVKKINFLNYPIDSNRKFRGKPLFGSHKTWRGLIFGILAGILIVYIQYFLQSYQFFSGISILDYSNWLTIGFLFGAGALVGDLVKSFFKRRSGVKAGERFMPWDQLDYTIGSLLFISFIFIPSLELIAALLIINFILHILVNHLAFYLRLSKVKW